MDTASLTSDQIERHLADLESAIGRLQGLQARLIAEADHRQNASADGCRAPYPTADAVWAPSPCR